ncbi:glycosyltransferase family 2 protein [Calothrix sp. 336/3]|uniref:glycosyltransferase family 2 protein n=1 Tax=Calothrix sp. 336/3 TaxID=1337936 RepID=UPI0004E3306C|nr:glycosyltransferase family A protein [Calothrix sp. 336/3]AKG20957.1 glycosyl transferase family 2 [Calothrix sp. 336/3]
MISKPLISCIIIFFNAGEQFFIEAIESVFAQTYETWELLLVDDGSSDISTKIAIEYAKKYPERVRYLEHEGHQNCGMSATRNLGVNHAKGEYIAFLDADDIWLSNILEEQTAILDSHPDTAMVYGPIQWWYSWTGNIEDTKSDFVDTPQIFLQNPGLYLDTIVQPPILFLLLLQMKISISGMLVRRQAIEKVGGFEDTFRGLYEDQVFCSKICLQFPVFVASQYWYKYRQHPKSCCAIAQKTKKEYWHLQRPVFLNWLEQYLSEKGFKYTEVWEEVQKELWSYRHPTLSSLLNCNQYIMSRIKQKLKRITLQKLLIKAENLRV